MSFKIGSNTIPGVKVNVTDKDYTLAQMAIKSVPVGDIVINTKAVAYGALRNRTQLTKVVGNNLITIGANAFYGCTGLEEIIAPNVIEVAGVGIAQGNTFYGCSSLNEIDFPLCITENNNASNIFNRSGIVRAHLPLLRRVGAGSFSSCSNLQYLVLPQLHTMSSGIADTMGALLGADFTRLGNFPAGTFKNCVNLSVLVLRRPESITTLGNISAFDGTPFASAGSGGTLYVPESLIDSYTSASNWSTILSYTNNQIKKIEGTVYETQYADGTPFPTLTLVSFSRIDNRSYDNNGGYTTNNNYASTDFINKSNCNEWELWANGSTNVPAVQEFKEDQFVGMGSSFKYDTNTVVEGEVLSKYKIVLPNGGTKFRFSFSPKSIFNQKASYLYKVMRNYQHA